MSAERFYRLLLRAYPPDFRAKYGREMALLFRDQCREGEVRSLRFWAAVIWDVARSAPALRAEAWRAGANQRTRTLEVIMRLIAMLTVLLAAFLAVSAMTEWVAWLRGPMAGTYSMAGTYVLSLALAIFASALFLTAGVALRRGTPSGRKTASLALLASLAMIVAARLLFPWTSLFSRFVSIGLPVALLIALHWPRRPSASGATQPPFTHPLEDS